MLCQVKILFKTIWIPKLPILVLLIKQIPLWFMNRCWDILCCLKYLCLPISSRRGPKEIVGSCKKCFAIDKVQRKTRNRCSGCKNPVTLLMARNILNVTTVFRDYSNSLLILLIIPFNISAMFNFIYTLL